jgi:hypothetical protein
MQGDRHRAQEGLQGIERKGMLFSGTDRGDFLHRPGGLSEPGIIKDRTCVTRLVVSGAKPDADHFAKNNFVGSA